MDRKEKQERTLEYGRKGNGDVTIGEKERVGKRGKEGRGKRRKR